MQKEKINVLQVNPDDLKRIEATLSEKDKTRFLTRVINWFPNVATTARKFFDSPYGVPVFMPDYARASYAVKMIRKAKKNTDKNYNRHGAYLSDITSANPIWMQLQKRIKNK